jgi:predicted GNAT family acetyltransferase
MEEIIHEIIGNRGGFYYETEGRRPGEMLYTMRTDHLMTIDHTEVDGSLKGLGVGKRLLSKLVEYARSKNIKVVAICPFANATFKRMKEWQDVLA